MSKKTAWRPWGLKELLPPYNNDDVFNAPSNTDPGVIASDCGPIEPVDNYPQAVNRLEPYAIRVFGTYPQCPQALLRTVNYVQDLT